MPDYIPRSDTEFQAWVANFAAYAGGHVAELGIDLTDIAPIGAARTDFEAKMAENVTAQQSAQSARQAKDASRDSLESAVRELVRRLQASGEVDDAERAALGITTVSYTHLTLPTTPYV